MKTIETPVKVYYPHDKHVKFLAANVKAEIRFLEPHTCSMFNIKLTMSYLSRHINGAECAKCGAKADWRLV